jgi:hypothetical protein
MVVEFASGSKVYVNVIAQGITGTFEGSVN